MNVPCSFLGNNQLVNNNIKCTYNTVLRTRKMKKIY